MVEKKKFKQLFIVLAFNAILVIILVELKGNLNTVKY